MGKVKRIRQKAHRASQKESQHPTSKVYGETNGEEAQAFTKETWDTQSNVFKNVKIDSALLQQSLPDFDARSGITNKSLKDLNLNKKTKQKVRHELWLQKLDAVASVKKSEKERKKRQQTAIVGDLKPLQDCLPTLDRLLAGSRRQPQSTRLASVSKPKGLANEKRRKKQQLQDMAAFAQVVQHSAFKQRPVDTIKEHLLNRMKLEDQMDI